MDGQEQTPAVQPEVVDSQAQTPSEPVDIAQAFQMLRESNEKAAEPAEQEGEAAAEPEPVVGDIQPTAQPVGVPSEPAEPAVPDSYSEPGEAGGSPVDQQGNDYAAIGQGIIERIKEESRQEVLKEFSDNNIKIMGIGDIYERRDDGTVVFNNPDDPRHPFSSRAEAQAWIDSMNAQIQAEYQNRIAQRASEKWSKAQPQIQLLRFAPYYEKMTPESQKVFDMLIEPYSIEDEQGRTIGFNCNLASMANQAISIANQFAPKQQPQQQQTKAPRQSQASTPALDIKSGAGESPESEEPKNINEAMQILNKMRKEKKNG